MPTFLNRLFRPFTSSTRMGLNPEGGAQVFPEGSQKAIVAAGCFWGVEHLYRKQFGGKGLLDAKVGYIGGDTKSPSYRSVCSGRTGHAEALQVTFDPSQVTYHQLLEFFYKMHDPTTKDRQGGDSGTQYRSAIFYHDEQQEKTAKEVTDKVQKEWWRTGKITTQILPAGEWWDAEAYHQLYLDKNPGGYECPAHYIRSFPSLSS
ncbi:MAG: Peptide-methionine (S)-S-oxide reductase [Pleopsidium flavum]|nr:MAG: Peptide-methionine (S)-S-oxide reductase [Pleopsidium flavum]